MTLVYLLIFAVILYCSESKQIKRYLQKGGVEPAVAVGGIIVFAVVVGLLIWFLTRDKSSPTPAPTTKPSHRRHHHGHVGSPPSDTPPHGGITPPVDNTLVSPFSSPCSFKSPGPGTTTNMGILNQQCRAEGSQKDSRYVFTGTTCSQPCYTALVSASQCSHLDTNPEVNSSVQNNIKHCKQVSPHLKEPSTPQGSVNPPHSHHGDTATKSNPQKCIRLISEKSQECLNVKRDKSGRFLKNGQVCPQQCLDKAQQLFNIISDHSNDCHQSVVQMMGGEVSSLQLKAIQDVDTCRNLPRS